MAVARSHGWLQAYSGLSSVAYLFMGVLNPASRLGGWTAATMGGLQSVAAVVSFRAGRSARSSRHYPCSSREHNAGLAFDAAVRRCARTRLSRRRQTDPGLYSSYRPSSQSLRQRLHGATSIRSRPPSSWARWPLSAFWSSSPSQSSSRCTASKSVAQVRDSKSVARLGSVRLEPLHAYMGCDVGGSRLGRNFVISIGCRRLTTTVSKGSTNQTPALSLEMPLTFPPWQPLGWYLNEVGSRRMRLGNTRLRLGQPAVLRVAERPHERSFRQTLEFALSAKISQVHFLRSSNRGHVSPRVLERDLSHGQSPTPPRFSRRASAKTSVTGRFLIHCGRDDLHLSYASADTPERTRQLPDLLLRHSYTSNISVEPLISWYFLFLIVL